MNTNEDLVINLLSAECWLGLQARLTEQFTKVIEIVNSHPYELCSMVEEVGRFFNFNLPAVLIIGCSKC